MTTTSVHPRHSYSRSFLRQNVGVWYVCVVAHPWAIVQLLVCFREYPWKMRRTDDANDANDADDADDANDTEAYHWVEQDLLQHTQPWR